MIDALDLHDIVPVGHSTGGGEVTRYVGWHGTARVAKVVLLGAIPPLMLKTDDNPDGLPIEPFDQIRAGVLADRSQFYRDLAYPFFGANRDGSNVSQGARDAFWLISMTIGINGAYDCVRAFSETDLTDDLKKIDVPTLILCTATTTRSFPFRPLPSSHRRSCRTPPSRSTPAPHTD